MHNALSFPLSLHSLSLTRTRTIVRSSSFRMSRCTICHASLLLIAPPPACTALASIFKLLCCSCCCCCAASSWLRCNSLVYVTSRTGACLVRQTFTAAATTTITAPTTSKRTCPQNRLALCSRHASFCALRRAPLAIRRSSLLTATTAKEMQKEYNNLLYGNLWMES